MQNNYNDRNLSNKRDYKIKKARNLIKENVNHIAAKDTPENRQYLLELMKDTETFRKMRKI